MADSNFLQYKERGSALNRTYPLVKLIWVFIVAVGLFIFKTPYSGAVMFVFMLTLAVTAGRISLLEIFRSGLIVFGLGILLMIFHLFADPGEPLMKIGFITITDNGIFQGPIFFFRLSVIVLASFVLIWTTDTRDLMRSLVKARMPYRYAFTIFLALRFLPLIQREVNAVRSAHAIRGKASGSGLSHRFALWQRYVFTILVNGLRKAEITADALDCRAFGHHSERTYVKDVFFHGRDILLPVFTLILLGLLIVLEHYPLIPFPSA